MTRQVICCCYSTIRTAPHFYVQDNFGKCDTILNICFTFVFSNELRKELK